MTYLQILAILFCSVWLPNFYCFNVSRVTAEYWGVSASSAAIWWI